MTIRYGLVQGLIQGSKYGINWWGSGNSIYTMYSLEDINTFIQERLSTSDDYLPFAAWNFDVENETVAIPDFLGTTVLDAANSASTVSAVHGFGANQVNQGAHWETAVFQGFGTEAFAFAARVKFDAVPDANRAWLGRGSTSNSHYALIMTPLGYLRIQAKESGIATTATTTATFADGNYHWVLGGRSSADAKIWIQTAQDGAVAAFSELKDLSGASSEPFMLGDSPTYSFIPQGGVDCTIDHLICWMDQAAENVYTNRLSLLFEDPVQT